jgi:hypothetical protein
MPMNMFNAPKKEMPEGQEFDDIMSQDIESSEESPDDLFGKENPLESALSSAGYSATPEQLTQIEAILGGAGAENPMGAASGMKKPSPIMPGGALPGAMETGDIPQK